MGRTNHQWIGTPQQLLDDFLIVANLAGIEVWEGAICIEALPMPHRPPTRLPKDAMAVYVFSRKKQILKIGKVGPNSQARYTSQHYNPNSAKSTLALSILKDNDMSGRYSLTNDNISSWIKRNTDRVNFLLDVRLGVPALTLFEAFAQCRLRPIFEGFSSQR